MPGISCVAWQLVRRQSIAHPPESPDAVRTLVASLRPGSARGHTANAVCAPRYRIRGIAGDGRMTDKNPLAGSLRTKYRRRAEDPS